MGFWKTLNEENTIKKLNIIANIFSIIGISVLTLFQKIVFEKVLNKNIDFGDFFLGLGVLTLLVAIYFLFFTVLWKTKIFFLKIEFGAVFFYLLLFFCVFIGLSVLFPLVSIINRDLISG